MSWITKSAKSITIGKAIEEVRGIKEKLVRMSQSAVSTANTIRI